MTGYVQLNDAIIQVQETWHVQPNTLVLNSRIYVYQGGSIETGEHAMLLGCYIVHEDESLNVVVLGSDNPMQACFLTRGDIAKELAADAERRVDLLRLRALHSV